MSLMPSAAMAQPARRSRLAAAATLASLGFDQVANLRGGMLAWNERGLPVERGGADPGRRK